jgi:glycosyltransferase involved in cell wall biosynthesis
MMPTHLRVLTPLHSPEPGGVERVALRLNAAWQSRGIEALVVLGREEGAVDSGTPAARYCALPSVGISTAPFETLWMIARLPAMIRRLSPDILFCAGNTYSVVMLAMRLLLGRSCPMIVAKVSNDLIRRDLPPVIRWYYRRWLRLHARFIDIFVGIAEPMRDEIAEAMGVDPASVWIIDDPALSADELNILANAARGTRPGRRFVAAGRLVAQKNFALLLRAFARIAGHDDRLTIIGDGPQRAALEHLASELGIADRVSMPGHQSSVANSFERADCFLLSSDYEGVPAVIIEALASGLPIVATRCSVSMDFLLQHGQFGKLVDVRDVEAFASAMQAIDLHPYCATAARSHATRFVVEHAAHAYIDLFHALASAHGFPVPGPWRDDNLVFSLRRRPKAEVAR